MKHVLTMLDTTGTQDYIFGSNRLQENIGASQLVYAATKTWVRESIPAETDIWYTGGGNAALIFTSMADAKAFARRYSFRVLSEAPGLNIAIAHQAFDWETEKLADVRNAVIRKLAAQKQALPAFSTYGLSLGVTDVCASTGLAAHRMDSGTHNNVDLKIGDQASNEPARPVSMQTITKIVARDASRGRLSKDIAESLLANHPSYTRFLTKKEQLPAQIDDLARQFDQESYVAVVHADGNNMGQLFKTLNTLTLNNDSYRTRFEKLSKHVNEAGKAALQDTLNLLLSNIQPKDTNGKTEWFVKDVLKLETRKDGDVLIPFRPLIYGGDDVTFLTNGTLGITLGVAFIEAFEKHVNQGLSEIVPNCESITAAVGVSIVKMHYPFIRAYEMAEALAKNAKKLSREVATLDWHFAPSGLAGELETIRQTQYANKSLLMRPMYLQNNTTKEAEEGKYWQAGYRELIAMLKAQIFADDQQQARNKLKQLPNLFRKGKAASEQFLQQHHLSLPLPYDYLAGDKADVETSGFASSRCIYFDALELMDHHLDLTEVAA